MSGERDPGSGQRLAPRLLAAMLAAALLAALSVVASGYLLLAIGRPRAAGTLREWLASGAWIWIPLWGASLGALRAVTWAGTGRRRLGTLALALILAMTPLVVRPRVFDQERIEQPRTLQAKARSILKWSYRSPARVARIVELSRDPDPRVREQAVLALGINLVVSDIEHATRERPSRFAGLPLRDTLRIRLLDALHDSSEAVRSEAARALWKAPRTFGRQDAAAETLAAVLGRATRPSALERLTWLALDAAAGAPDPRLKAAAARFAAATSDSELRRVALEAARDPARRR